MLSYTISSELDRKMHLQEEDFTSQVEIRVFNTTFNTATCDPRDPTIKNEIEKWLFNPDNKVNSVRNKDIVVVNLQEVVNSITRTTVRMQAILLQCSA